MPETPSKCSALACAALRMDHTCCRPQPNPNPFPSLICSIRVQGGAYGCWGSWMAGAVFAPLIDLDMHAFTGQPAKLLQSCFRRCPFAPTLLRTAACPPSSILCRGDASFDLTSGMHLFCAWRDPGLLSSVQAFDGGWVEGVGCWVWQATGLNVVAGSKRFIRPRKSEGAVLCAWAFALLAERQPKAAPHSAPYSLPLPQLMITHLWPCTLQPRGGSTSLAVPRRRAAAGTHLPTSCLPACRCGHVLS